MAARTAMIAMIACACKSHGDVTIALQIPPSLMTCFDAGDRVFIHAVSGKHCSECTCSACGNGGTVAACNGACTLDEVKTGLDLDLPAGQAALIYDFVGSGHVAATACVDIDLDTDGTSDLPDPAQTAAVYECCAP